MDYWIVGLLDCWIIGLLVLSNNPLIQKSFYSNGFIFVFCFLL